MDKINTKAVSVDLASKSLCETSKSYLLGIESYIHIIYTLLFLQINRPQIGVVNSLLGSYSKYETLCSFKPKHECFNAIIYCLSASFDIFTCIYIYLFKRCFSIIYEWFRD